MEEKNNDAHVDLRVIRTRRCIQHALLDLLHTRPLDKLSVGEICDTALVNKGTFYRHYQDKYELAARTATELLDEMRTLLDARLAARLGPNKRAEDPKVATAQGVRLGEVVGGLILLQDVEVGGTTVRERVRALITRLLEPYARQGLLAEDVETEAWVLTMVALDYPTYEATVKRPLRPLDYARSVQEVAAIYEDVFRDDA